MFEDRIITFIHARARKYVIYLNTCKHSKIRMSQWYMRVPENWPRLVRTKWHIPNNPRTACPKRDLKYHWIRRCVSVTLKGKHAKKCLSTNLTWRRNRTNHCSGSYYSYYDYFKYLPFKIVQLIFLVYLNVIVRSSGVTPQLDYSLLPMYYLFMWSFLKSLSVRKTTVRDPSTFPGTYRVLN